MKIGDVCRIKNVEMSFYLGNPVIVIGNQHDYNIISIIMSSDDKKYYKSAFLADQSLEYIGSDDIINYVNIL